MTNRRDQFNSIYMETAKSFAKLSYAERKKVGAVLVDINDNIISYGFNGTVKGSDNTCEYIANDGTLKTKDDVLHAESNAISKVAKSTNSSTNSKMYVTLSPCLNCAKLIVQSGITELYYYEEYRDITGLEFLKNNGIYVKQIQ